MSTLGTIGILGVGGLLLSQFAKSQDMNLGEFLGGVLSKFGNVLQSLFGGGSKEKEQTQDQTQSTEYSVVSNDQIQQDIGNETTTVEQSAEQATEQVQTAENVAQEPITYSDPDVQSMSEIVQTTAQRYTNEAKYNLVYNPDVAGTMWTEEQKQDAKAIANDLANQGVVLQDGEDPRSNLYSVIKEVMDKYNTPGGQDYANNVPNEIFAAISSAGIFTVDKDLMQTSQKEQQGLIAIATANDGKIEASAENAKMLQNFMPEYQAKSGNEKDTEKAFESALKKLTNDKSAKKAFKAFKKSKSPNKEYDLKTTLAPILHKYLKEEGVEMAPGTTQTQASEKTIAQYSLADMKSVSKETSEQSKVASGASDKADSIEQVVSKEKNQETKGVSAKETSVER